MIRVATMLARGTLVRDAACAPRLTPGMQTGQEQASRHPCAGYRAGYDEAGGMRTADRKLALCATAFSPACLDSSVLLLAHVR